MAHVPDDLLALVRWVRHIDEGGTSVNVVSPQTQNHRFDRVHRAFVKNEISRKNVDCGCE